MWSREVCNFGKGAAFWPVSGVGFVGLLIRGGMLPLNLADVTDDLIPFGS